MPSPSHAAPHPFLELETYYSDQHLLHRFFWLVLPVLICACLLVIKFFPSFWDQWIDNELWGLQEWFHVLIPLLSMILALRIVRHPSMKPFAIRKAFFVLFAIAMIYLAGEELDWGQHHLEWAVPNWFNDLFPNQRTNLHNVQSDLAIFTNKLPRSAAMMVLFSGVILPTIAFFSPALTRRLWLSKTGRKLCWAYPTLIVFPSACCGLFVYFLGKIGREFGFVNYFHRMSEIVETFMVMVFCIAVWAFLRRLSSVAPSPNGQQS